MISRTCSRRDDDDVSMKISRQATSLWKTEDDDDDDDEKVTRFDQHKVYDFPLIIHNNCGPSTVSQINGIVRSRTFSATACRLHWLDVSERVMYKLALAVQRCLQHKAPQYPLKYCVYQSLKLSVDSICDPPFVISFCWSRDVVSAHSAVGLSLLLGSRFCNSS